MTADFLFCRPGAVAQFRPGAVVRLRRGAKLRRRLAVALYLLAGAAAACEVQEGMAPAADSGSLVVLESQLEKVARGDGSSEFSETLAEHNRAVNKYQRGR